MELREGELADAVDRHEQIQLALFRPHLCQVDVDVPERIGPELTTWWWALEARQAADTVALEKPMQRGAREMRNRRLKSVEAIIERQSCVTTERYYQRFLVARKYR
jgi:hypothetical protein